MLPIRAILVALVLLLVVAVGRGASPEVQSSPATPVREESPDALPEPHRCCLFRGNVPIQRLTLRDAVARARSQHESIAGALPAYENLITQQVVALIGSASGPAGVGQVVSSIQ